MLIIKYGFAALTIWLFDVSHLLSRLLNKNTRTTTKPNKSLMLILMSVTELSLVNKMRAIRLATLITKYGFAALAIL